MSVESGSSIRKGPSRMEPRNLSYRSGDIRCGLNGHGRRKYRALPGIALCSHPHAFSGRCLREEDVLEKGAELACVSKAFQKIAVFINDLNRELDAAVKGFYYIMKGIFINYGI